MGKMNRALCLLLVVFLLVGFVPLQGLAQEQPDTTSAAGESNPGETTAAAEAVPGQGEAESAAEEGIAAYATGDTVYVLAGSDFQPTDSNTATGVTLMNDIMEEIYKAYPSFDGLLFGGDYNYNYDEATCIAGKNAVQKAVTDMFGTVDHQVYIQGNHDPDSMVGSTLTASGANDPASGAYGVFVINEKDYMWYNNDTATVRATAAALDTYLTNKVDEGFGAPVFVISHLPLHYCLRTQVGGGDGKDAAYLFEVLQKAGEAGLNVIFLYGHNHSHGWDDPYGGGAVYLQPGDPINIAEKGSTTSYTEETLAFTYMNPGFVAYYRDVNPGADVSLTMTVFAITDGQVTVERYDANGQHNLKSAGVLNSSHHTGGSGTCCSSKGTETYAANESVVWEDTIILTAPEPKSVITSGDVTVVGPLEITGLTVTGGETDYNGTALTVSYGVQPTTDAGDYTGTAIVKLALPSAFTSAKLADLEISGADLRSWSGGVLTLEADSFPAEISVGYALSGGTVQYHRVTDLSGLESGEKYLIVYASGNKFVTLETTADGSNARHGFDVVATGVSGMPQDTVEGDFSAYEWTLTASGEQWYLGGENGNAHFYTDGSRIGLEFSENGTAFTVAQSSAGEYTLSGSHNNATAYWQYNNTGDLINGYASSPSNFYFYKKSAQAAAAGAWTQISDASAGETVYQKVTQTSQLQSGETYVLIYDASQDMYVTRDTVTKQERTGLDVVNADWSGNPEDILEYDLSDYEWVFTQSGEQWYVGYGSQRLAFTRETNDRAQLGLENTGEALTVAGSNGLFTFSGGTYVFDYSSKGVVNGYNKTASANFYIYQNTLGPATEAEYARLAGQSAFHYNAGQDAAAMWEEIRAGIQVYSAPDGVGEGTLVDADSAHITFEPDIINTAQPDTYLVTVRYKGVSLGRIAVSITQKQVKSISLSAMEGTTQRGVSLIPDSFILVTYVDGTTEQVPLRASYLSGQGFTVSENGVYEELTVTYGGKTLSGYTLHVVDRVGNDFPLYPEPGSVKVDKTGTGVDFQNTGLAKIELSAAGIPASTGIDLVIVVDTSSSMDTALDGHTQSRIEVLSDALGDMLTQLSQPNAVTGDKPDIDLAVISFNGYSHPISGASLTSGTRNDADTSRIYTGSKANSIIPNLYNQGYQLSQADFISMADSSFTADTIRQIAGYFTEETTTSGTNYDAGLMNAYTLLAAKKASNDEERKQVVVFLSDGAPFRYNGFTQAAQSSSDPYTLWNKWLLGEWEDKEALVQEVSGAATYSYFYNGDGTAHPHRMAQAIKGAADTSFTVVDRLNPDSTPAYTKELAGLDATVYSVGFCLKEDGDVTVATEQAVLQGIASGEGYTHFVNTADDLGEAFSSIASSLVFAATDAVFEDKLGDSYELQLASSTVDSQGNAIQADNAITIQTYPIYTQEQVGTVVDGHTVVAGDVGSAYGPGTLVETITFNADGTAAYSDAVGEGVNILTGGKLQGQYVTYDLTSETFFWRIGTLSEQQYTLSYMVYLTDSMNDPGVPEGNYDTNLYARLNYVNYLGNAVSQSVPSPTLPWRSANVSYAFYLVNDQGEPLLASGQKASGFLSAYKVVSPVLWQSILFNTSDTEVASMRASAADVLPEGYTLYDPDAAYGVAAYSGGGGRWEITTGSGKVASTYVTGFAGTDDYSNAAVSASEEGYDYSHTTVYFAVHRSVGTVEDVVVIDYGLPVDIDVLYNDLFGSHGTLAGVGGTLPGELCTPALEAGFDKAWQGQYGEVSIVGTSLRYTPVSMNMPGSEGFAYAVYYDALSDNGYYYGNVTVIPATTIYYEDNFLSFSSGDASGGTPYTWTVEGKVLDAVQDQDRPGQYSLPNIDANNVYGFDSNYLSCTTYSLGSARKVTVEQNKGWATAEFTFTGTGFDVVSLTSNRTGTIIVTVTDTNGQYDRYVVDTYYGYTQDGDGNWVVVPSGEENALYQIPVMKIEDLAYGTYHVEIRCAYSGVFDHEQYGENKYDFYLDAIRIYDPANDGESDAVVKDAYVADKEGWPQYHELRNIIIDNIGDFITADHVNGIVYIDGKNGADISEYIAYGPNNEVYLSSGSAVAFKLDLSSYVDDAGNSIVADVQIGIKSADGDPVTATLFNLGGEDYTLRLNEGDREANTATDLYYSAYNQCTQGGDTLIVLQNTGEGILSVTNMKLTFTQQPAMDTSLQSLMTISFEEASFVAMALMCALEPDMPEEETPVQPDTPVLPKPPAEPEATQPPATQPAATQPAATQPAATQPAATQPAATQPAATQPAATEPAATEPAATEPAATPPLLIAPAPSQPQETQPEATQSQPESSQPDASQSVSGESQPDVESIGPWLLAIVAVAAVAAAGFILALIRKRR